MRRALILLAFACVAQPASAASCTGADTALGSASLTSARAAVLCIVNAERAAHGLPAVTGSDKLALAAQRHTEDMVARDFFDHYAPAPAPFGVAPGDRIAAAGYTWSSYGENIAAGYRTPRAVMTGWMQSKGHCENVLDPGATQLGVGVTLAAATIPRGVGTWTQDFGRPRGVAAPSANDTPQAGCPYSGLEGIDGTGTVTAPVVDAPAGDGSGSAPAEADAPAAPGTGGDTSSGDVPAGTTPADPAALLVRVRHAKRRLLVAGTLAAPDRTRVRIVIVRRGHVLWRGGTRVSHGQFALRLRTPRRLARLTVVVRAGTQQVTRFVR